MKIDGIAQLDHTKQSKFEPIDGLDNLSGATKDLNGVRIIYEGKQWDKSKSSNDNWKKESADIKELENILEEKIIDHVPEHAVDGETTGVRVSNNCISHEGKKLNISKRSNDSWKKESVEIQELENIFEGKTIEPAPENVVDDETTQLLSNTNFADVTRSNKMDDSNETLHKPINCEEVKNMKNYVEEQENIDKLESSSQDSSDKCSMIEGSEVGSETLEDARNNAERIERVLESTTNEVCTIASVKNSIICYSNTSKEQKNSKEKIESIAQSDHTQQRNSTNDFDLNRKHNNNSEKKKSEDIMKGDLSHDIINKVFTSLKISCRDYRNKISILGEHHEQVTFLINDEFGRYIYAQIDKSTYNQIINDPTTLTTIDMNMINGCYLKDASLDLSVKTNVMKLIHSNYLQDASSTL